MGTDNHPSGTGQPAGRAGPGGLGDPGLDEGMLAPDPVVQFSGWLAEAGAAGLPEPNAMVLSTVTGSGRPRARSVLLKSHGEDGFVFYTNHTSAKAQDLSGNPWACLLFPWYALRRQVIIQGAVSPLSEAESEPYFHSRAWLPAGGVGQQAVVGDRLAGRAGRPLRAAGAALAGGHDRADAQLLGRLPAPARRRRVLAGPDQPAA